GDAVGCSIVGASPRDLRSRPRATAPFRPGLWVMLWVGIAHVRGGLTTQAQRRRVVPDGYRGAPIATTTARRPFGAARMVRPASCVSPIRIWITSLFFRGTLGTNLVTSLPEASTPSNVRLMTGDSVAISIVMLYRAHHGQQL